MSGEATAHHLQVSRTARYWTLGDLHDAREIWIVLHGYGQLAQYFIQPFGQVARGRLIVAPEGLSRFYLEGNAGRIGASWMTREDRELEIIDQIRYLDGLCDDLTRQRELPVHVLGFSQGTATACRWACNGRTAVQRWILWGGDVPPDLDPKVLAARSAAHPVQLVVGRKDPYIDAARVEQVEQRLRAAKASFNTTWYDAGHTIDPIVLERLLSA